MILGINPTFQVRIRRTPQGHYFIRYRKRRPIRSHHQEKGVREKLAIGRTGLERGGRRLGRGVETTRSSFRCHLASLRFFPVESHSKSYISPPLSFLTMWNVAFSRRFTHNGGDVYCYSIRHSVGWLNPHFAN